MAAVVADSQPAPQAECKRHRPARPVCLEHCHPPACPCRHNLRELPLSLLLLVLVAIASYLLAATVSRWLLAEKLPTYMVPEQYLYLDALRGLMAFLVLLNHALKTETLFRTGEPHAPDFIPGHFLEVGIRALSVFFMISGFLFWGIIRAKPLKVGQFIPARLLRLVPPFLVVAVLCFMHFCWYYRGQYQMGELPMIFARIASLGIAHEALLPRFPMLWQTINMAWTIWVELKFYLLLPLLSLMVRRSVWVPLVLFGLLCSWRLQYMLPVFHGCLIYEVLKLLERLPSARQRGLLMAAGLAAIAFYDPYAAGAVGLLLLGVQTSPVAKPWADYFLPLGKTSYSFYLSHGLMLAAVYPLSLKLFGDLGDLGNILVLLPLSAMLTAAFSCYLFLYFETLYFRWKRRNRASRPAVAA